MKIIKTIMSIPLKLCLYIVGCIVYVLATGIKLLSCITTIIRILIILSCVLMSIIIIISLINKELFLPLILIVIFYIFSAIVYSLIDFVDTISIKLKLTAYRIFKLASFKGANEKNDNISYITFID